MREDKSHEGRQKAVYFADGKPISSDGEKRNGAAENHAQAQKGDGFCVARDRYDDRIRRHTPRSPLKKNLLLAGLFGGSICAIGEGAAQLLLRAGVEDKTAYLLVTVGMIFLAAALTGIGVYDRIARHAGAGTLVPVTGFANAVVSPAIDNKSEGALVGIGTKIFTVAGPVILFAVLAGTIYGAIFWLVGRIF